MSPRRCSETPPVEPAVEAASRCLLAALHCPSSCLQKMACHQKWLCFKAFSLKNDFFLRCPRILAASLVLLSLEDIIEYFARAAPRTNTHSYEHTRRQTQRHTDTHTHIMQSNRQTREGAPTHTESNKTLKIKNGPPQLSKAWRS